MFVLVTVRNVDTLPEIALEIPLPLTIDVGPCASANVCITSKEAKITDHENIIDEVVLRDNFTMNTEKKSNIYNENILSVIIKIKEIQDKNSIDIKLFDKSNNIKIINEVNNFILNHSMDEIFNTDEGWSEITKQFNQEIYRLVLETLGMCR